MRWIKALVLAVGLAAVSCPVVADEVAPPRSASEEALENFQKWRASIPDYELRLYQRVKLNNAQALTMIRLLVANLVLTIGVLGGLIYVVRRGPGREPSAPEQLSARQKRLEHLGRTQEDLLDLMEKTEKAALVLKREAESFNRERSDLQELMTRCHALSKRVGDELDKLDREK